MNTTTQQQSRTEITRNNILNAAIELYVAQGVQSTSISTIIDHSGAGRTTFYRYFNDADDVLNQAVVRDFNAVMAEFETQRHEHASLTAQIVEDMVWFIRKLQRGALGLLFSDNGRALYHRLGASLASFGEAGMACSRPTFTRAQSQGRLRPGVTLEKYVDWVTFIVVSVESVQFPMTRDEFRLREMLRDFLVPSLILPESDCIE